MKTDPRLTSAAFIGVIIASGQLACDSKSSGGVDGGGDALAPNNDMGVDGAARGDSNTIPLSMLHDEILDVFCEKLHACCTSEERAKLYFVGNNVDDCKRDFNLFLHGIVAAEPDSVAKGRIVYRGDKAAICMKEIRAQNCVLSRSGDIDNSNVPECGQFYESQVPIGGVCTNHKDCINGYCDGTNLVDPGVCKAVKPNGAGCAHDDECISRFCDGTVGACGTPAPEGLGFCRKR